MYLNLLVCDHLIQIQIWIVFYYKQSFMFIWKNSKLKIKTKHIPSYRIQLLSLKLQTWRLLRWRSSLTFRQITECSLTLKLARDMIRTHFCFVVVLKIEIFMCLCFQHFRNFGKNMEPKCKLKYIFIYFTYDWFNTRRTSFWFKNIVVFIIWVCKWICRLQDLMINLWHVKKLCIMKL